MLPMIWPVRKSPPAIRQLVAGLHLHDHEQLPHHVDAARPAVLRRLRQGPGNDRSFDRLEQLEIRGRTDVAAEEGVRAVRKWIDAAKVAIGDREGILIGPVGESLLKDFGGGVRGRAELPCDDAIHRVDTRTLGEARERGTNGTVVGGSVVHRKTAQHVHLRRERLERFEDATRDRRRSWIEVFTRHAVRHVKDEQPRRSRRRCRDRVARQPSGDGGRKAEAERTQEDAPGSATVRITRP